MEVYMRIIKPLTLTRTTEQIIKSLEKDDSNDPS